MRTLLLCCVLLTSSAVQAGEVLLAEVEYSDKRYFVDIEMIIGAPPEQVHARVTDYDNLTDLHEIITESEIMYSLDERTHRVRVVLEACITYFCKTMVQVQDIEELDGGIIIGTVVSEQSDFEYAHSRWKIEPHREGTQITFNSDLKPAFWVPPVIGPLLIKRKLRKTGLETIAGLETLAGTVVE